MIRSAACLMLSVAVIAQVYAADHPRLLFGKDDVPALREKIKEEPFKAMFEKLKADSEVGNWGSGPIQSEMDEAIAAQRNAFIYVLTGDDAYAKKSRGYVEKRINDARWANGKTKGLSLFMWGACVSHSYDWCYGAPSWDASFAATVSKKLQAMGDVIYKSGGAEQNRDAASNWQGIRFAAGGICALAHDEAADPKVVDGCFAKVSLYLKENMGPGDKSRGWNTEGLGYTYYPFGNFICPFGQALLRKDPKKDIREVSVGAKYSLWTVYAATVRNATGMWRPDFGDDNPGTAGEGTYGWAFWMSPKELQPGLVWAYDHLVGSKGDRSYDASRFGTIASILHHPGKAVTAQDPLTMPKWRELFVDTGGNGFFTYRNRYGTADDIAVQLFAKLRGNRGHSGPDSLSFRIYGLDGLWAVGGGRYGPKHNGQDAYWRSQNTLYPVDPDAPLKTNDEKGRVVGTPVIKEDGSGSVVLAATANNVGTKNLTRRFLTDFSARSGAEGVVVISDSSDDGKFWQLCTVETHKIETKGNTFTVTGPTGHTLQGTVLYPKDGVKFKTGTRPRGSNVGEIKNNNFVTVEGSDGDFLVVLTLQKKGKAHPAISADGTFSGATPKGSVKVGGLTVTVDAEKIND